MCKVYVPMWKNVEDDNILRRLITFKSQLRRVIRHTPTLTRPQTDNRHFTINVVSQVIFDVNPIIASLIYSTLNADMSIVRIASKA